MSFAKALSTSRYLYRVSRNYLVKLTMFRYFFLYRRSPSYFKNCRKNLFQRILATFSPVNWCRTIWFHCKNLKCSFKITVEPLKTDTPRNKRKCPSYRGFSKFLCDCLCYASNITLCRIKYSDWLYWRFR